VAQYSGAVASAQSLGLNTRTVKVFVSSADEPEHIKCLRDRVDLVVGKLLNSALRDADSRLRFECERWEDFPTQKAPVGGKTNDLFVSRARESALTMVLLHDDLRPGTEEEVRAVLNDPDVELAVQRYSSTSADPYLDAFLEEIKPKVLWGEENDWQSEAAWIVLLRPLLKTVIIEVERLSPTGEGE
jgi:hypothetical protein